MLRHYVHNLKISLFRGDISRLIYCSVKYTKRLYVCAVQVLTSTTTILSRWRRWPSGLWPNGVGVSWLPVCNHSYYSGATTWCQLSVRTPIATYRLFPSNLGRSQIIGWPVHSEDHYEIQQIQIAVKTFEPHATTSGTVSVIREQCFLRTEVSNSTILSRPSFRL